MSGTLIDNPSYTANNVPSVLLTDKVEGQGVGASHGGIGNSNAGAQALANRTAFLYGRQNTNINNIGVLQAFMGRFQSAPSASGILEVPTQQGTIIAQWGTVSLSEFPQAITFPTPFTEEVFNIGVSEGAANTDSWGIGNPTLYGPAPPTLTGFSVWGLLWVGAGFVGASPSNKLTLSWRAIGI